MTKQSMLRDIVDGVFGRDKYLDHAGVPQGKTSIARLFNKCVRPQYLVMLPTSIVAAGGDVAQTGVLLSTNLLAYKGIQYLDKPLNAFLNGRVFETANSNDVAPNVGERSLLELVQKEGKGKMAVAFCAAAVMSAAVPEALAVTATCLSGMAVAGFGDYWRTKQVLDHNWSLLDKDMPDNEMA